MVEENTFKDGWVLQFCHGYDGPFLDCARQYAVLFKDTGYRVCTVYLTGEPREEVIAGSASDEVIFLNFSSRDIRGLKLKACLALKKIAASRRFHFCIAHRFKPTYIALLATTLPVIGVQHAFGVYNRKSRRLFANLFRSRLLLLGVSNAVRDDVRACLPKWPGERIETLYNRIDVKAVQSKQVSREAARRSLGVPQDAWVIGNVGRLHPDKDQRTLIKGFAEALPTLPAGSLLLLVGAGRLEEELKALVARLGIGDQVLFAGLVPEAFRYFKAFDAFVLSSGNEGFGMVLIEAMAAGVPVASSSSKAGCEIVANAKALFPAGDHLRLAEKLVELSQDSEIERSKNIQNAYARLNQEFSDETARRRFVDEILPRIQAR